MKDSVTERTREKTEQLMEGLSGVDDATTLILRDMVEQFAWYSVTCTDLREQISREGNLIEGKENPSLAVLHKTSSRMHEFGSKIATIARRAQADETDALMDFIA